MKYLVTFSYLDGQINTANCIMVPFLPNGAISSLNKNLKRISSGEFSIGTRFSIETKELTKAQINEFKDLLWSKLFKMSIVPIGEPISELLKSERSPKVDTLKIGDCFVLSGKAYHNICEMANRYKQIRSLFKCGLDNDINKLIDLISKEPCEEITQN